LLDVKAVIAPHNEEAEQGILGSLLIDNNLFDDISSILKPSHFFFPAHERVYSAISDMVGAGKTASAITLKNHFENDPDLDENYLADIVSSVIVSSAPDYARIIKDLADRRGVRDMALSILEKSEDYSIEQSSILAEAESALTAITDQREYKSHTAQSAIEKACVWMRNIREDRIKAISTGYKYLDDKLGGLFGGGLYILAGRPGMGKTALMLNFADNISSETPVVVISLEMRAEELGMRLIAARTGISVGEQRLSKNLTDNQWNDIRQTYTQVREKKLFIEDCAGINISALKSIARRYKRLHGNFVFMVDYLGLLDTDRGIKNKVHQIEEITKSLKVLAKELDIPVVILSQLNRGVEARDDKRPMMSDLRDSGAIEQDADVVMFTYRAEYYEAKNRPVKKPNETEAKYTNRINEWQADLEALKGKAEIVIGKNRQGTDGIVPMRFDGVRQRFES